MRVSVSSEIAVSVPSPQSRVSGRPSRLTRLSSPVPPLNRSSPPPPNRPSLPPPPLIVTGSVTEALMAATSSPSSSASSTEVTPAFGQTTLWPSLESSQVPSGAPSDTPPKRAKRTLSACSKAEILSSPVSPV
jgi:hypothetical protein